jgi:acyl-coenzyme A synthetase/AMP-(fatty) acid ligase
MVKIRGYRVEPEEVEHVLRKHPAVREAVVVPVIDPSGATSLAAVVSKYDVPLVPRDLQRLCAEHLPEVMIPAAFTFTDGLPQTSTGKIDRRRIQSELNRESPP